ncbi:rod shape-determining protein MreD [Clostridium homopropionicum DSM 5847]|uniref:Rod shape-determining protein MreD n=1 Tax=Clostridium homopropionicum DSM 5847 TaxID=1121318 RepID=A0A0L6ZB34_9CLOT|nr:rod shape-determining protein MreD [Clostridium homopropionicum]KOA20172.1 rod shape-determining protein MreD [Clostridium homopropionicum DSM 5847]SFG60416.1 rod shape-determining protein MreD [Clostridium homopropionicum]
MKKIFTVSFLIIALMILDNALMPFISIKGVYPSLLFLFVICYSIVNGSKSAVILGIFSGLLQDIYFIDGVGINMLLNMIMCLIAAQIGSTIFKDKIIIPVLTCILLMLLKGILMLIVLYILGNHVYLKVILYRSIYSIPFSIFMYRIVYKLCERPFMVKNWRF